MAGDSDTAVGFIACAISSVFFGSMFVPLKKFDCADGIYVQWVMCVGIFLVGVCVHAVRCFPKFYPLAMLGGALWTTGNVTAIPIINTIGMTLGILLWSFTGLVFGWASGKYGWFGLIARSPGNIWLNYGGLVLGLISTVMFAFVKNRDPNAESPLDNRPNEDTQPILVDAEDDSGVGGALSDEPLLLPVSTALPTVSDGRKRIIAIVASLIAGIFYGLCFAPVIWIQDNVEHASKNGLDYVFAHYCGIIVTGSVYFAFYAMYKRNSPIVNAKVSLPALCSGIMWAIAQSAFFVANDTLSEAVSFPIISRFPGLISAIWGVFVFKEIRGRKNLKMLSFAIIITIAGGILAGLSRVIP